MHTSKLVIMIASVNSSSSSLYVIYYKMTHIITQRYGKMITTEHESYIRLIVFSGHKWMKMPGDNEWTLLKIFTIQETHNLQLQTIVRKSVSFVSTWFYSSFPARHIYSIAMLRKTGWDTVKPMVLLISSSSFFYQKFLW